jgi:hypothetical protein
MLFDREGRLDFADFRRNLAGSEVTIETGQIGSRILADVAGIDDAVAEIAAGDRFSELVRAFLGNPLAIILAVFVQEGVDESFPLPWRKRIGFLDQDRAAILL